jgi:deazaflavin-dependent oxidoreductase (nitroreductase family)
MDKRGLWTSITKYGVNPFSRLVAGHLPGFGLLEHRGRRSGRLYQTPVSAHREGDVVWLVAEHGAHADYVRNLRAEPHVRLRVGGQWRSGRATVLPDDDAVARTHAFGPVYGTMIRTTGSELLTIKIDLDGPNEEDHGA